KPLSGLAEKDLARGIHEPEDPMRIKRKDRHVYLLDDRREKRRSLNRSAPLGLQDVAQAVDLGQDVAQGVVSARTARPEREVPFPQGEEQVRHGLQRPDDPLLGGRRESEPARKDQEGHGAADLRRMGAAPYPGEREDDRGQ